ncbi:MAG: MATE family efflux transporter [Erysipelotrichaceae bacterium]|nr:MATE family efflux transporter [Erysipelotrichaceae bacterium]
MSENKYFGDRRFYGSVARLAIPSMLQQLLSSAMGMVDTMMVSAIGMVTPVGIASQIGNICNAVSFGVMEGTGIYASQFFGAKDERNLKRTFGLSIILSLIVGLTFCLAVTLFPVPILHFYVKDSEVVRYAAIYIGLARFAFPLTACVLTFSYFYRCIHKTNVSMWIGIISMSSNCLINYILIYGKLGFSPMGVAGAAWGTLLAQVLSLTMYITYSLASHAVFIGTIKEMTAFDWTFVRKIMHRTYPTIINETLFGFGTSLYVKAYGLLGTKVTDAYYVANTITNMFFSVCNGMSVSGSMLLGAELGRGNVDKAITQSRWIMVLGFILSGILGSAIVLSSNVLVGLFNLTDPEVYALAVGIMRVTAVRIALRMVVVIIFSSLRAGGDSRFLMFLDCGIVWLVGIPLIYALILVFGLKNFVVVYLLAQLELAVRILIGMRRFTSNRWAVNLTREVA